MIERFEGIELEEKMSGEEICESRVDFIHSGREKRKNFGRQSTE